MASQGHSELTNYLLAMETYSHIYPPNDDIILWNLLTPYCDSAENQMSGSLVLPQRHAICLYGAL